MWLVIAACVMALGMMLFGGIVLGTLILGDRKEIGQLAAALMAFCGAAAAAFYLIFVNVH